MNTTVLEFLSVHISSREIDNELCILDLNLKIRSGEIVFLELLNGGEKLLLGDLSEGLIPPEKGEVLFKDDSWTNMSIEKQTLMRSKIGRVFFKRSWISNLTILENIILKEMHCSKRDKQDILNEAYDLASKFHIEKIPEVRPYGVSQIVSRTGEWIRAFMGNPEIIILEYPEFDTSFDKVRLLGNVVNEFLEKGSAVLWITDHLKIKRAFEFSKHRCYVHKNNVLNLDIS